MPFKPLVTAGIETALNTFLWRDKALKPARQRLLGKVLRVELKELSTPVVLVFSERQVDVLGTWEGDADCTVITRLSVLPQLRNRQQLTALIRSGDLEVQGDLQVVQNTVALCDLAEFDPAELLAPYTGDIVAEGVSKVFRSGARFLLFAPHFQHRVVDICQHDAPRFTHQARELRRQVAGTAGQVQNGLSTAYAAAIDGETLPQTMNTERHQIIHNIIFCGHRMEYMCHHVRLLLFGYRLKTKVRRFL